MTSPGTLNWQAVVKYWPIIVAVVGLMTLGIETRLQVKDLIENRDGEGKQWAKIGANEKGIENLQTRMGPVESRLSDDAFAEWNRWRATMDARVTGVEVDIRDLQRAR